MFELPSIGETKDLDDHARNHAPGLFARLSAGQTHYEILGPIDGRLVILIHGIASPMEIWDSLGGSLAGNGLRVLKYDLFGRGLSDRPNAQYDIDFFLNQLEELLSGINFSSQVVLIGWSLGAIISASYAAKHHERVGKLVLIAPAGVKVTLPTISKIGMFPILGDIVISIFGRYIVTKSIAKGLYNQNYEDDLLSLITQQMEYRGYLRAFLSTLRNCGHMDAAEIYMEAGEGDLPVLMISGSDDPSIPGSVQEKMRKLIPTLEYYKVNKAGHIPHFEQPVETSSRILAFLNRS